MPMVWSKSLSGILVRLSQLATPRKTRSMRDVNQKQIIIQGDGGEEIEMALGHLA